MEIILIKMIFNYNTSIYIIMNYVKQKKIYNDVYSILTSEIETAPLGTFPEFC